MKSKGYKMLIKSSLSNERVQNFYRKFSYKDTSGLKLKKRSVGNNVCKIYINYGGEQI